MPLQPSNVGAAWQEPQAGAASADAIAAWFGIDGSGDFYPTSSDMPPEGAALDLSGGGVFDLTDITGGYPAYVAQMQLVVVNANGDFVLYE